MAASMDFREFVKQLSEEGDVLEVMKEVDPNLEVGAITRRVYETGAKAPLFNKLIGRKGDGLFRILGAPLGVSKIPGRELGRVAKSLGLESTASAAEIINKINEAKEKPPVPCVEVENGPIKENKVAGDDIDLNELPVPFQHEDDGGKYIQTFGMFAVQSPDGEWTNWSITRAMVHDKRHLVGPIIPKQDIGTIFELWKQKGQDMPFALCFGVPPAAIMVGGMPIPKWTNEPDFIGALTGKGVEVVKSETNNLFVPASSEIVFEGVASISQTGKEGPMAEYHGMVFPGESRQCPLFRIDSISYRNDPILPLCVAGRAPEENHTVWSLMQAAEVLNICQHHDLPIKMVWCPFESHCLWFTFQVDRTKLVKLQTTPEEFCRKLGNVVFGSKPGWYIPKIFLVGEDVDPANLNDVIWAEATRCEPGRNEFIFTEYSSIPLIPYVSRGFSKDSSTSGKVIRCCMLPVEFTDKPLPWKVGSFQGNYPQSMQNYVLDNWKAYGFE